MNFKLIEPGLILQTGSLDDILNIPMGPSQSFKTNYQLAMLQLSLPQLANKWMEYAVSLVPRKQFQINPKPDEVTVDLNLGNRPFKHIEEPMVLTKVNYMTIEQIVNLKHLKNGGKGNVKNHHRINVGTIGCWDPKRSALCTAILECKK